MTKHGFVIPSYFDSFATGNTGQLPDGNMIFPKPFRLLLLNVCHVGDVEFGCCCFWLAFDVGDGSRVGWIVRGSLCDAVNFCWRQWWLAARLVGNLQSCGNFFLR